MLEEFDILVVKTFKGFFPLLPTYTYIDSPNRSNILGSTDR